ncbi:hemicentin-2-like [Pseudophryne corroboree]|uniref:hemicentin-2-like n=1 Tax=Pseudophryne corroboree TaxID=495146 RepID=UPI0030821B17
MPDVAPLSFSSSLSKQIHSVQVTEADSYVCVAENPAGFAERLLTLNVHVPPRIFGATSENVSAVLHSSLSLVCDVQSHPSPDVTWYKDGQIIQPGRGLLVMPGGQVLQIARVQLSNQGTYMCKVKNPAGSAEKQVHLTVYVPPSIKEPPSGNKEAVLGLGGTLTLVCETDAVPERTVTWYKNGQPFTVSSSVSFRKNRQRLEVRDVQASDKGLYTCKMANVAGEDELTYTVIIQLPASILHPQNETIQLTIGSSIFLSCEAQGYPPPKITWLKDGEPLEHSSERGLIIRGSRLQINRPQQSHTGLYSSIAQNHLAEVHKDFLLLIQAQLVKEQGLPLVDETIDGSAVNGFIPSILTNDGTIDGER